MKLDTGTRLATVALLLLFQFLVTTLDLHFLKTDHSPEEINPDVNNEYTLKPTSQKNWKKILHHPRFRSTVRQLAIPLGVAALSAIIVAVVFANQARVLLATAEQCRTDLDADIAGTVFEYPSRRKEESYCLSALSGISMQRRLE
jgi:hypothetical protein